MHLLPWPGHPGKPSSSRLRSRGSKGRTLGTGGLPEDPNRVLRDVLSHADERSGAHGHLTGARIDSRALRDRAGARVLRQQLPSRPAARRARREVRAALPLGLGYPWHFEPGRYRDGSAREVPGNGPRVRRPRPRSPRARTSRRDPRGLGRRVRAHADERGTQPVEVHRPQPPPSGVHGLARGRRNPGRDYHRRDGRARLQHRRGPHRRPRPSRDGASSSTTSG